jgi:hypothetical protein
MQLVRSVLALAILLTLIAAPARAQERVAQRAFLYDEDPLNPKGQQQPGTVLWCLNRIKSADGSDDVEILGKVDITERRLKMIMSLRRNVDASLPASHVIELKFSVPAGFNGGGVGQVPGLLMKTAENAKGAPLVALSVKVTDGLFMIGLSNAAQDRAGNVRSLIRREWFDLPFVYKTQRRGIIAIEKGPTGRQVFQAAFAAWGEAPSSVPPEATLDPPRCSDEVASHSTGREARARYQVVQQESPSISAQRN